MRHFHLRGTVAGALTVLAGTALGVAGTAPADAAPAATASGAASPWAPAATAAIHPGVMTYTAGAQCTANFVFTDDAGDVLVGQAAHCSGTGSSTQTDGCTSASLPLGTKVTFSDDGNLLSPGTSVGGGSMVYNSWLTMQKDGETDPDTCAYNDLALVKVDPADAGDVNPSVPFFGGPVGLGHAALAAGAKVYSYGNSSLRAGLSPLSPKVGTSLGDDPADGGWSHPVYTLTPGIPGDSGSGLLDADGRAVGVLSTVALAPRPGSNDFGDLGKEVAYAAAHSGLTGLRLVPGTAPFSPAF